MAWAERVCTSENGFCNTECNQKNTFYTTNLWGERQGCPGKEPFHSIANSPDFATLTPKAQRVMIEICDYLESRDLGAARLRYRITMEHSRPSDFTATLVAQSMVPFLYDHDIAAGYYSDGTLPFTLHGKGTTEARALRHLLKITRAAFASMSDTKMAFVYIERCDYLMCRLGGIFNTIFNDDGLDSIYEYLFG